MRTDHPTLPTRLPPPNKENCGPWLSAFHPRFYSMLLLSLVYCTSSFLFYSAKPANRSNPIPKSVRVNVQSNHPGNGLSRKCRNRSLYSRQVEEDEHAFCISFIGHFSLQSINHQVNKDEAHSRHRRRAYRNRQCLLGRRSQWKCRRRPLPEGNRRWRRP